MVTKQRSSQIQRLSCSLAAGLPVATCSMIHSLCRAICQYYQLAQFAVQDSLSGGNVSLSSNYIANSLAELLHLRPNFQPSHFIKSTGEGYTSANTFYTIKTLLFCCSKKVFRPATAQKKDKTQNVMLLKHQIIIY